VIPRVSSNRQISVEASRWYTTEMEKMLL